MPARALGDLRVLDLCGPIGWYATKLLADLGADVLRIEPPSGDPARQLGPVADGESLHYCFFNTSKRARTLDLQTPDGQATLWQLACETDALVTSQPLPFSYDAIAREHPALVWTAITPFGLSGPHAHWRATDLIGVAAGGLLNLAGVPASPPSHPPSEFAFFQAGLLGAVGTLLALRERQHSGRGQLVEVSLQEALLNALENTLGFWDLMGIARCRLGTKSFSGQTSVYRCADGWVVGWLGRRWEPFVEWLASEGLLPEHWRAPEWSDPDYRLQHLDEIDTVMHRLIARLDRATLVAESQRRRIATGAVVDIPTLFADPQLIARDYWVEVESPDEIRCVQEWARDQGIPLYILGGGTNVLVSDLGVRGCVVRLGRSFAFLEWKPNGGCTHVRAGAALPLKKLVREAVDRNLTGLEFAEGIPGTVGGG
ncbi:MAG: CoA transferase, partial [Chloroflexi bacterium]|nr:CoA transferase [Chloroflexota bacterium]